MAYDRINWENTPSHVTPLSAENLNTMDEAIDNIDEELNRVGVKAVNLEARMDTAETNIVGIGEELTEQDTYAKGMGAKTLVHETDIATLKSQVTQIIDGGPASPSELTDVRISENGTAYPTAGEAVRAQVRQMIEVQDTQPTDPGNKLWINDGSYDSEDHQVPTWDEFSELKADLNQFNGAITKELTPVNSVNILNENTLTNGFVSKAGEVTTSSATLCFTEKIPVTEGDVIRYYRDVGSSFSLSSMRFITAYSGNTAVSASGATDESSYTVPSGIDGLIITIGQSPTHRMITKNKEVTEYSAYVPPFYVADTDFLQKVIDTTLKNEGYAADAKATGDAIKSVISPIGEWHDTLASMSDGDYIEFDAQNIKNDVVFNFSANITSFDAIKIGMYYGSSYYVYILIDDTNVTFYGVDVSSQDVSQAHGLTISGNIQVHIEKDASNYLSKVVVISSGQSYECTGLNQIYWVGDKNKPRFESVGSTLTGVSASFTSRQFNKPIWLFGDSYVSFSNERWVRYLINDGYDKSVMINGIAGERSQESLVSCKNLLEKAKPQYIVWTLGMNDPDTDNDVNSDWEEAYEELKTICENKNIKLILATVPNVHHKGNPILHDFKNAIIKASGLRYIDFSTGVGADAEGYWITGLLNTSDEAHPTVAGAKALYYRALCDFPEFVTNCM